MNWKFTCSLVMIMSVLSGCAVIKIQQNLPGSLWGNWAIERIGYEQKTNMQHNPYLRACVSKDDIIHFSSDRKMTFKWHDSRCSFQYYMVGRYQVNSRTLTIMHDNPPQRRNVPFYLFDEYHIHEINETTLELRRYNLGQPDDNLPRLILMRRIRD